MTVEKFLNTIGRGCEVHISKFETWEKLFSTRGRGLKELGIPLRDRKYMLNWIEKYRQGWEPRYVRFHSRTTRNKNIEWRWKLFTQKEKRIEYGLDQQK